LIELDPICQSFLGKPPNLSNDKLKVSAQRQLLGLTLSTSRGESFMVPMTDPALSDEFLSPNLDIGPSRPTI
jgi:hypothetical protein